MFSKCNKNYYNFTNITLYFIENHLDEIEDEDHKFRQKIEKLREHAGESWLTVYNEMNDDQQQQTVCSLLSYNYIQINPFLNKI